MEWTERHGRPGWVTRYLTLGGRPFEEDPLHLLDGPRRLFAERATSHAFLAHTAAEEAADDDVKYWATLVTKYIQRGIRPPIPSQAREAVRDSIDRSLMAGDILAALIGQDPVELDSSFDLDDVYEAPFWKHLLESCPGISSWCIPQAPLEAMAGLETETKQRWVDFLFTVPWNERPFVLEIDGSGHLRQPGIDKERGAALGSANVRVRRLTGGDATAETAFLEEVSRRFRDFQGDREAQHWVTRLLWGPAAIHRTMYAIALAVVKGFLPASAPWVLALDDDTGAASRALGTILGLLRSFSDVWKLDIVPDDVVVNGRRWRIGEDGEYVVDGAGTDSPLVHVILRAREAPHNQLPEVAGPTIVIRSAPLPIGPAWASSLSRERRNVTIDANGKRGLHLLLRALFGFPSYREGQLEAITRILSGGDACVLLPTGAGKTLVYQVAGLLRPGTTVVAAPLIALIDDQHRRMIEMGIDRCVAITSEKGGGKAERLALLNHVRTGAGIFVIIAPERLQIQSFRDALLDGAAEGLVNLAVIDEAHCVSEWGHQFRPSYLTLGRNLRRYSRSEDDVPPPLLALTGTASPAVLRDVLLELGMSREDPGILYRPASFDRENLAYSIMGPTDDRMEGVRAAIDKIASDLGVVRSDLGQPNQQDTLSGIVFVPHSNSGYGLGIEAAASAVADHLKLDARRGLARFAGKKWEPSRRHSGFARADADAWGAETFADFKRANADAFRNNDVSVMVATNAFGMGIDKPNIRWTLHVTHPNSLEAFAQEAGRAGRNGKPATCVLVTSTSDHKKSDLDVQKYFLDTTFPDQGEELKRTGAVIRELAPLARPGRDDVRIPTGRSKRDKEIRERALYRLVILGFLDDYTVERNSFTVEFAGYTEQSLQKAIRRYIDRVTGGRRDLDPVIDASYSSIEARLLAHADLMVKLLYETVVPGRERALQEMNRLAVEAPGPEEIRNRLNAYLGAGEVSLLMDRVIQESTLRLGDTIAELRNMTPVGQEWAAASARFLESYPDHPVMLLVNALGEAWLEAGDRGHFERTLEALFANLEPYGVNPDDGVEILEWVLGTLRRHFNRVRWEWAPIAWKAWDVTPWGDELLIPLEDEVLSRAANGRYQPEELAFILARRLRRAGKHVA